MRKYTRPKDQYECRIAGECPAEEWFENHGGNIENLICNDCPFEELVNALAEYEDAAEAAEDDGK